MGKALVVIVVLVVGLAAGLWLALGPRTPAVMGQSWDHVKAAAQQLPANAESKIHEIRAPGYQGGAAGPNLIERVITPFADFAAGIQKLFLNLGKSIRPAP
jgi:hypothetical protein